VRGRLVATEHEGYRRKRRERDEIVAEGRAKQGDGSRAEAADHGREQRE
jgi:hypothetical protein